MSELEISVFIDPPISEISISDPFLSLVNSGPLKPRLPEDKAELTLVLCAIVSQGAGRSWAPQIVSPVSERMDGQMREQTPFFSYCALNFSMKQAVHF